MQFNCHLLLKFRFVSINKSRNISFKKLLTMYRNLTPANPTEPPYSHIVQIGDPVLRVSASDVPKELIKSSEMQFLIKLLKSVMKNYNCVGLSAPQIGLSLRIFVMQFDENKKKLYTDQEYKFRYMAPIPFTVFINPQLKITDYKQVSFVESCESVKGYSAEVPRYFGVECTGFDEAGEIKTLNATGWTARIIQHEMDHLNGEIYTDIMDRKTLTCTCWHAVNSYQGRIELPFYNK